MSIRCLIFGHNMHVHKKAKDSPGIRWLRCSRCGYDGIVNHRVKLVPFLPMDFELMDMHTWEEPTDER